MQIVIDGFFSRFEILDNMFALSTANQMAPHVGKKQKKPKELKLFSKKASAEGHGEQRSAEDDKAAFRRLKQHSKQRAQMQRAS